jgi:hypothetical protein
MLVAMVLLITACLPILSLMNNPTHSSITCIDRLLISTSFYLDIIPHPYLFSATRDSLNWALLIVDCSLVKSRIPLLDVFSTGRELLYTNSMSNRPYPKKSRLLAARSRMART